LEIFLFLKTSPRLLPDNDAHSPSSLGLILSWKVFCEAPLGSLSEKTLLVDKDGIVTSDSKTSNNFNTYFIDITKTLDIHSWSPNTDHQAIPSDPVLDAITRYSILFQVLSNQKSQNRKSTSGEISPKILQKSANICFFRTEKLL